MATLPLSTNMVETHIWNNRLQPQEIKTTAGGTTLLDLNFFYCAGNALTCINNNGNLRSQLIAANDPNQSLSWQQNYGYTDGLNRLTTANETQQSAGPANSWNMTNGYDNFGNRTETASYGLGAATASSTAQYNANNQMVYETNGTTAMPGVVYDAAGNQTGDTASDTIKYDAEGHQWQFANGANIATYGYDGEGRRVSRTLTGTTTSMTTYVYDAEGQLSAEYSSAPPGETGTTYLTADHLGSTRLVTSVSGAPLQRFDYGPFGEDLAALGVGNRNLMTSYSASSVPTMKFTGKERDSETGLDYFGARYFSSAQGLWTSPDWSGVPEPVPYADLTDPQTLNLYSYVRNNPLSHADPDGHCTTTWDCVVTGAKAVGGGIAISVTAAEATAAAVVVGAAALIYETVKPGAADGPYTAGSHYGMMGVDGDLAYAAKHANDAQPQQEPTRGEAQNDAKRDAGVPTSQQPEKQETVPLTDPNGKQVVVNGKPQTSREYTHTTGSGEKVVIQDHSQGHSFPDAGQVGPHFNVRPQGDTRNGTVPGTQSHYPYKNPDQD